MRKKLWAGMVAMAATAMFALGPVSAQAQSVDAELRVQQLEETVRQLNGRVEEMSFQLLQMQEQLRKAQEDNEFRFQELEGGKSNKKSSLESPDTQDTANNASGAQTPEDTQTLDAPSDSAANTNADPGETTGAPPVDLGQLKFDQNGNPINDPNAIDQSALPPPDTSTTDDAQASQSLDNPETSNQTTSDQTASVDPGSVGDQYQSAYEQVLAGDYAAAEAGFTDFIATHPDSKKAADANFWLGEAQYSQGKYSDSARTFLGAYKKYGKSEKAPEMLLKLAMSLAQLESTDTACATLREVTKAYPKASRAVINKVASEQKRLAC